MTFLCLLTSLVLGIHLINHLRIEQGPFDILDLLNIVDNQLPDGPPEAYTTPKLSNISQGHLSFIEFYIKSSDDSFIFKDKTIVPFYAIYTHYLRFFKVLHIYHKSEKKALNQ